MTKTTDRMMSELQQMEALYRDLRHVASWLDQIHPETATHSITPLFNNNRDRSTDISNIAIDYLGRSKSGKPLSIDQKRLAYRLEDKIEIQAKVAICALGHRIIKTGNYYITYAGTYSAEDLSAHERIEATRRIDDARSSSYARIANTLKSFEQAP